MEFYRIGDTETMSMQELIEGDLRSEIDNILRNGNLQDLNTSLNNSNSVSHHVNVNGHVAAITSSAVIQIQPPLQSVAQVQTTGGNVDLESSAGSELGNLSWLHNVDVPQLSRLAQAENNNPNLLVNPQTGMPIQTQIGQPMAISIAGAAPSPAGHGAPQVQYVTITSPANIATTAQQPMYIQQPASTAVLQQHLQSPNGMQNQQQYFQYQQSPQTFNNQRPAAVATQETEKMFPKPVYSYSCLIAMALKNSKAGSLPVSEIYNFMIENFPYFKSAPDGWKNSVRHNLSLNKCFEKIENPKGGGTSRKGCLWAMNPAKIEKMMDEIAKWRKKDPIAIKRSMAKPEDLDILEKGEAGLPPSNNSIQDDPEPMTPEYNMDDPRLLKDPTLLKDSGDFFGTLNGLDHNLELDPSLSELALQNGIWDDFNSDDLNLDIPITTSPFNISGSSLLNFSSPMSSASPTTFLNSPKVGSVKVEPMESATNIQGSYIVETTLSGSVKSRPTTPRTIGTNT
ncbi:forkhead box protein N4-like isoform X1 [Lingula anatina]|uniref:Forkhead box protein N4-like isoform X1 n=1 Tax=Lingula anatina TaxID=7574 RepID=A0A1S3JKN9_LINAN|nr:forkhead box protein N4-like isoform X1 [Lingula anatina]XP_013410985.1 forkhead box protein N4-like isoform X1 [Lingula anatina]|eukprot:XP_013410984.1 forkhead box protein N4-like isoform X1 [Lingula anatina]